MTATQDDEQNLDYRAMDVPSPEVSIEPKVEKAEKIPRQKSYSLRIEQKSIESPFIPPEYLEQYEKIYPGMGERLMEVIIEHQKFQMEVKRSEIELTNRSFAESVKVNDANIREQDSLNLARSREIDIKARGQVFALIITVLLIASAFGFALLELPILAGSCIAIIVAMAVVMFLQKTYHDKAEDQSETQAGSTENE